MAGQGHGKKNAHWSDRIDLCAQNPLFQIKIGSGLKKYTRKLFCCLKPKKIDPGRAKMISSTPNVISLSMV